MKFTDEEYEILKTVEDKLYTATYCKFVRLVNREQLEKIDTIYKRVFNTSSGVIGGCSHCVYTACKKLGTLFFEDKKAREAKKTAVEESIEEKAAETQENPKNAPVAKKKATAKKKTNNKKK